MTLPAHHVAQWIDDPATATFPAVAPNDDKHVAQLRDELAAIEADIAAATAEHRALTAAARDAKAKAGAVGTTLANLRNRQLNLKHRLDAALWTDPELVAARERADRLVAEAETELQRVTAGLRARAASRLPSPTSDRGRLDPLSPADRRTRIDGAVEASPAYQAAREAVEIAKRERTRLSTRMDRTARHREYLAGVVAREDARLARREAAGPDARPPFSGSELVRSLRRRLERRSNGATAAGGEGQAT